MNPQLRKLVERLAAIKTQQRQMCDAAEAEDRDFTEDEAEGFKALQDEAAQVQDRHTRLSAVLTAQQNSPVVASSDEPDHLFDRSAEVSGLRGTGPALLDSPTRGFTNFGEFASTLAAAHTPGGSVDSRLQTLAAATGGSQGVGADGGFLVPPTFSSTIWDGLSDMPNNLLAMTDQYTVTGDSLTFNANAETDRATGSRYGGIQGYWISEADQITSSKPTFRQIKLEPNELAVLVYETNKVLRNATALEQHLTKAATEEIAFLVNDAIINGTGAGQPAGVLSAGATYSVPKETGQDAATIVAENVFKMYAAMHTRSLSNAVWFINQECWPQLFKLTIDGGTSSAPVFIPPGGLSVAPYGSLLGRPIMPIEYCAALGTVGDILFADLGTYATGTQGAVESAMSIHLRFDYAETCFRFMFAVDGRPWMTVPKTPFKGTASSISSIVSLATRS